LSVSLFIECRRVERVKEADETRLQRELAADQDYEQQLRLREQARKLRADPPATTRRRGGAGSAQQQQSVSSQPPASRADKKAAARKLEESQLSLAAEPPEEPPLVRVPAATADLVVYVESPEEVLARDYRGCVRKETLVACIYEDPSALTLLRLPPRRPGTYPPFASLFRDVAPTDPPLLGPGPGPLCECLWALAFRMTTPITLPYTYGVPGAHPRVCGAGAGILPGISVIPESGVSEAVSESLTGASETKAEADASPEADAEKEADADAEASTDK
jgi:hypothetical protein